MEFVLVVVGKNIEESLLKNLHYFIKKYFSIRRQNWLCFKEAVEIYFSIKKYEPSIIRKQLSKIIKGYDWIFIPTKNRCKKTFYL